MERNTYRLIIYFIGGTTFSTEYSNEKGIEEFKEMIEDEKLLKKFNYFIRVGDTGVNVRNINVYNVEKVEDKQ